MSYNKIYYRERYHKWRQNIYDQLGGECVVCGSKEKLELDHIDPENKTFPISRLWSMSPTLLQTEIEKLQLLCKECHILKTNWNNRMAKKK